MFLIRKFLIKKSVEKGPLWQLGPPVNMALAGPVTI